MNLNKMKLQSLTKLKETFVLNAGKVSEYTKVGCIDFKFLIPPLFSHFKVKEKVYPKSKSKPFFVVITLVTIQRKNNYLEIFLSTVATTPWIRISSLPIYRLVDIVAVVTSYKSSPKIRNRQQAAAFYLKFRLLTPYAR